MKYQDKIDPLLKKYGQTYAEEIGIKIENTPSSLFQWLCCANLFSTRISSEIAVNAAKSIIGEGLTTPEKMKDTTWQHRVNVVHRAQYVRYDERTATFLGQVADILVEKYNGDIRKLREKANKDPEKIRQLLKEFKGMGDVGVNIFFREIQTVWPELYPFVDSKVEKGAKKYGLPTNTDKLADLVSKKDFVKLSDALVRMDLNHDYDLSKTKSGKGPKENEEMKMKGKSKEELYKEAKEAGIKGRSKMNKRELAKALANH